MITLGIDLSSQEKNTSACYVCWDGKTSATIEWLDPPLCDEKLLAAMCKADRTAIDAPFGWPVEFVKAIRAWQSGTWPKDPRNDELRLRVTDRYVKEQGNNPLSVSSDRIAATARRAAELLDKFYDGSARIDRVSGKVIETYPVAALRAWGIITENYSTYRESKGFANRKKLVKKLCAKATWLRFAQNGKARCAASEHNIDALVCALVARAASQGTTWLPGAVGLKPAAQRVVDKEGWIHLPKRDSFDALPG